MQATHPANKSYSAVLRAYDAQAEQMQRNQFQMRIEMRHMENYLKNGNPSMRMDQRRFSNTVKPENFYDYDHCGDEHVADDDCENRPSVSPYHFNRVQPDFQYPSPLESKSNPDSILTPSSSHHHHHHQRAVNTNNVDADIKKALQLDLEHMKQQKEDAEAQWQAACDKIEQLEQLNTSLAVELTKTKQETDSVKASLIQVTDSADNSRRLQDREKVLRAAAQRKADLADQRMKELMAERDTIATTLKQEKERARKLRRKSLGFDPPADDATLEQLLSEMEIQRKLLESAEYKTEWRQNTVKNMDLCLQILFVCERDIVVKKKKFMTQSAKSKMKSAVELLTSNKTGPSCDVKCKDSFLVPATVVLKFETARVFPTCTVSPVNAPYYLFSDSDISSNRCKVFDHSTLAVHEYRKTTTGCEERMTFGFLPGKKSDSKV